jgi:lipoprotein NlpI
MIKHVPLSVLLFTLSNASLAMAQSAKVGDIAAAASAYRSGDFDEAIRLTEGSVAKSEAGQIRSSALQRRGESRFFDADIEGSIADFDEVIKLEPSQDPHHWQRGLSYYYAEEYQKGKAQFERHQTVNTQDVENAVWHFLCAVRAPRGDIKVAQKELIPIEMDSRVPMKEVHDLFAGRATEEDVLNAAAPDDDGVLTQRERNHLCYAHLYLGLYHEAMGNTAESKKHIRLAAIDYSMDHYMGNTAIVHAVLRDWMDAE